MVGWAAKTAEDQAIRFGVLLPHFSRASNWDRLFAFAPELERLGYDSVWVRDNLSYRGHGFELPGARFVDPFTTLAGVAALTSRIGIGTAVLTPFRHPLVTAQLVGGLTFLSRGRFELGIGPGRPSVPWEAVGVPFEQRVTLCRETVEVIRLTARQEPVSYRGELTQFTNIVLDPAADPDVPVWYGGASKVAIRAIVDYCDGMLPGRCPFVAYDPVVERLRDVAAEHGRAVRLGSIPVVSIAQTREDAVRMLPLQALLDTATERWRRPFETLEALAGAVIAGSPDDCIEQLQPYVDRQIELVVVDLRLLMDEFESAAARFARDVIPAFAQSGGTRAA